MSPHPTSYMSVSILSFLLCLRLQSGLFPSGAATKTLYATVRSLTRATCPAHVSLLELITRIIFSEHYKSLCGLIHSCIPSFLLDPNIILCNSNWNTCSLCSSLNVRDQVWHPYKATGAERNTFFASCHFLRTTPQALTPHSRCRSPSHFPPGYLCSCHSGSMRPTLLAILNYEANDAMAVGRLLQKCVVLWHLLFFSRTVSSSWMKLSQTAKICLHFYPLTQRLCATKA